MNRNKSARQYDPATEAKLKSIPLPPKIRCGRCQKYVNQARFSTRQLNDARRVISRNPGATYKISCMPCSGCQVVELECSMCKKTQGLEQFSKAQRKKLDDAVCYKCIDKQLEQDAIDEEKYEDPDDVFVKDTSVNSIPDYFSSTLSSAASSVGGDFNDDATENGGMSLVDEFHKISLSRPGIGTLIDSEYSDQSIADGPGQWGAKSTTSWHTGSKAVPSTSSGFNPNKYGNPAVSSAQSSKGPARSFASSVAERSDTTTGSKGWAKIKAAAQPARKPEDWDSESSESDSDDDDDDDDDTEI